MSYEDDIARERQAEESLRLLAAEMAEECASLWRRGDGDGGHVMEVIRQAFYDRVGRPQSVPNPTRSRHISNSTKKLVFERDAYRCVKCSSYTDLCVDHIHPWSLGGGNGSDNLQTLCWKCNSKKSNKVEE